jgi:adenylate cyclase class 2
MKYEVEQKFRVSDSVAIEQMLLALGCKLSEGVTQVDTYFSHPARNFRETDEVLRLRCDGDTNFITYKGPKIDQQTKTRVELELVLPSGGQFDQQFRHLWAVLGFQILVEVRKRRKKANLDWQGARIEVAFDEVEGLGAFIELEATAEEREVDFARKCVASLAAHLGLNQNERRGYSELMLQSKT